MYSEILNTDMNSSNISANFWYHSLSARIDRVNIARMHVTPMFEEGFFPGESAFNPQNLVKSCISLREELSF